MGVLGQRLQRYPFLASGRFVAAALGHFTVDFLNSQRPLLLAAFSVLFGLTNTEVGFYAMSATLMAALSQPLFGWLADRYGGRWIAGLSLLWMGVFYMLVGLWPDPRALWLMVLAALGSGAFHPQGAMNAAQAGGDKRTLATSIFFTAGQTALALGPAIGGVLLATFGLSVMSVVGLMALPVAAFLWFHTPEGHTAAEASVQASMRQEARGFGRGRRRWLYIAAFVTLVFLRSWAGHSNIAFLPKFLHERGWPQEMQGLALTAYMAASAVAVIFLGRLADDVGRRRVLTLGLGLAVVPVFLYPQTAGLSALLFIALSGAFIGGVHSILIVMAQNLLPSRMALASGLALGFMFASGAIGQMITGVLADLWGLDTALRFLSVPLLAAAVLTRTLPEERTAS